MKKKDKNCDECEDCPEYQTCEPEKMVGVFQKVMDNIIDGIEQRSRDRSGKEIQITDATIYMIESIVQEQLRIMDCLLAVLAKNNMLDKERKDEFYKTGTLE